MAKKTKAELAEIEESKAELRKLLNPRNVRYNGTGYLYELGLPTVCFVIDSVSRSGMSRTMRVYVQTDDGLRYITGHVARVLGWRLRQGNRDAIVVQGCGMDMTFHLLDCLTRAVFGYGPDALNANMYRREVL